LSNAAVCIDTNLIVVKFDVSTLNPSVTTSAHIAEFIVEVENITRSGFETVDTTT
jgi:hypothetical protein